MNVKTLCLGILSTGEASGYEIKKEIEDGLFSHFIDASYGSIYPALSQLASEGLVTARAQEQTGKPDKKVYAITEAGRQNLIRSVQVTPARDKYKSEFLFEMLFREHLPETHIVKAMSKQIADLREDLSRIDECKAEGNGGPGGEFVAGYGEAVLAAGVKYLEQKLAELSNKPAQAAE
ncbi:MAG: PadR family transcriptional regulator [Aestuariivirga sp.]